MRTKNFFLGLLALLLGITNSGEACTGAKEEATGMAGVASQEKSTHKPYWRPQDLGDSDTERAISYTVQLPAKGVDVNYDHVISATIPLKNKAGIGVHAVSSELSGEKEKSLSLAYGKRLIDKNRLSFSVGAKVGFVFYTDPNKDIKNKPYLLSTLGTSIKKETETAGTFKASCMLQNKKNLRPGLSWNKDGWGLTTELYNALGYEGNKDTEDDWKNSKGFRIGISKDLGEIILRAGYNGVNDTYSVGGGYEGDNWEFNFVGSMGDGKYVGGAFEIGKRF